MGRVGVVDLESGSQGALGKRVRVVTEESVVVAEQRVVDCIVLVSDEQVLMLRDDLMADESSDFSFVSPSLSDQLISQAVPSTRMLYIRMCSLLYLNHHGCIGNVSSPGERFIPANQRICLIVVDGDRA